MAKINDWEKKATDGIKNTVTRLIKNISIVAIFIVLGIVTIASLGAKFDISGALTVGLGVASVLLLVGSLLLYELWLKNGQENGKEQQEFQDALELFIKQSKNIHNSTMQDFIEWEKARRYDVEKHKIETEIERLEERLKRKDLSEKGRTNLILKIQNLKYYVIEVDMPYSIAEELDEMKYSVNDVEAKEYKPNSARKALKRNRLQKYIMSTIFTLFSINIIAMAGIESNGWQVLFTFLMAVVTVTLSIVIGFLNGYNIIMRNTLGMYNTANDFIDKALGWCKGKGISLYYTETKSDFSIFALDHINEEEIDDPEDYYKPNLEEAFGRQEVIVE